MGRKHIHHRNFAVVFYVFCADLSLFKLLDRKNCFDEIEVLQIILAIKSDTIATDEITRFLKMILPCIIFQFDSQ